MKPTRINVSSYRNSIERAWERQCNQNRNVFQYALPCGICVQNSNELDLILTELCSVLYLINTFIHLMTSPIVLSQQSMFFIFLWITWQLKEILYYCKRPIHLFFHALSNRTIKIFVS